MNITLSVVELEEFATDLQKWYYKGLRFVVEHVNIRRGYEGGDYGNAFHETLKKFEEENPQPDWRLYLK